MDILNSRHIHITPADTIKKVDTAEKGIVAVHFDGGDSLYIATKKLKEIIEHLDDKQIGFVPQKHIADKD